jgi:predicted methyltransferase
MATCFDKYVAIFRTYQSKHAIVLSSANTINICVDGQLPTASSTAQTQRNVQCEHCDRTSAVLDTKQEIFQRRLHEFQLQAANS